MTKSKVVIQGGKGWGEQPIYSSLGSRRGPRKLPGQENDGRALRAAGGTSKWHRSPLPPHPKAPRAHSRVVHTAGCPAAAQQREGKTAWGKLLLSIPKSLLGGQGEQGLHASFTCSCDEFRTKAPFEMCYLLSVTACVASPHCCNGALCSQHLTAKQELERPRRGTAQTQPRAARERSRAVPRPPMTVSLHSISCCICSL